MQRYLLDGWPEDLPPPRLEEDLSFVPKDREEVIYIYMYRVAQNDSLKNAKRYRTTPFSAPNQESPEDSELYYEWPPLYLELYYLIAVHSKFRSDAERLVGWVMMRLHHATHLLYRPRRYLLPEGRVVDSTGSDWDIENSDDGVVMEKVALQLCDDLTIHEAPYRPYVTYQARCAIRGPLIAAPPTTVRAQQLDPMEPERPSEERRNGRMSGRVKTRPESKKQNTIGPAGHALRPISDPNDEG